MTDTTDYAGRVGKRLRAVRELSGLSLMDVEEKSRGRYDASTVSTWERADRHLEVGVLAGYAAFLRIPVRALLPDCPEGDADLARWANAVTARRLTELVAS